jgi:hypothetical protein
MKWNILNSPKSSGRGEKEEAIIIFTRTTLKKENKIKSKSLFRKYTT